MKKQSFFYIEALCESLKKYESNRDKYLSFENYYPELIKVFKDLSEQDLPDSFFEIVFTGPIQDIAYLMDEYDTVIITSTNEADKDIQDGITEYADLIRDRFLSDALLIKDTDALEMDLGKNIILAYGTMLFIKMKTKYFQDFIKKTRINGHSGSLITQITEF